MKQLINEGWRFARTESGVGYEQAERLAADKVCLPHDWAIAHPDLFYRDADGWYFRTLAPQEASAQAGTVLLRFDGVYMDAVLYLNGEPLMEHHYGYTTFYADLTGKLRPGTNEIAVQIRFRCPNSRWYSGAGIFRDVELLTLPAAHIVPDGLQIETVPVHEPLDGSWRLRVLAETAGAEGQALTAALYDGESCLWRQTETVTGTETVFSAQLEGIVPWSLEQPRRYRLALSMEGQEESVMIGFRSLRFTADEGFFLNGRHVKLHGVCLHHDLGALGAAFHPDAARRQLTVMKAMGVNAIRTSHNPPASAFLELCDEMGLLVDDEIFDMWELAKITYDNARFFPDTWKTSVAEWIRRDRCHPSVIMWSIGNEIQDMHLGERGYEWTRRLTDEARLHDRFRHAEVTFGSNYMPWEGAQRCAGYVKLPGYNYAEQHYDAHHAAHPDWVIYGSETASMVQSRGIYHFPMEEDILAEEDLQCSALLNSKTSWGIQSVPRMLVEDRLKRFSLGQFVWAGIDYIGEPTPYHTKNSYFGLADTACYPKDPYYLYQAMWSEQPMIHIGVRWNWNPGQPIDIPVMTNCAAVELWLNGQSLGKKAVDLDDERACLPVWQVPYQDGELKAVGYDASGREIAVDTRSSFGDPAALRLTVDQPVIQAGGLAFVNVTAEDVEGRTVDDAASLIRIEVSGAGCLMGLDNGDSTDMTPYQSDWKRLFSGKLLIMLGAEREGEIRVRVCSPGLQSAEAVIRVAGQSGRPLPTVRIPHTDAPDAQEALRARRICLQPLTAPALSPERPEVRFAVRLEPATAEQDVRLRVTTAQGVDYPGAQVRWIRPGEAAVSADADGRFYLRAAVSNGEDHTEVFSVYPVDASGFGDLVLNPYELIAGSLADKRIGEISTGNEQGIAFAREGYSGIGFSQIDFGPVGSDRIELPIFALDGKPHDIVLWDGFPDEGGRQIMTCRYQKPSIWNTYQPETYQLPEILKGRHRLFLSAVEKVHLKGIRFERQSRAFRVTHGAEADSMYGDQFRLDGQSVRDIGNNVTLTYQNLFFDHAGEYELHLTGYTSHPETPIMLRLINDAGETEGQTVSFRHGDAPGEQVFRVRTPGGLCQFSMIFLPGCHFDLDSFIFRE